MPLFYQCNGYKKGRLSQTTFTIAQSLFQRMLDLVKIVASAATQLNTMVENFLAGYMHQKEL